MRIVLPNNLTQQPNPTNKDESKKVDFEDLSKFKEAKGGKCVSDLFNEEIDFTNLSNSSQEFSTDKPQDSEFFGDAASDKDNLKGCLIINWEKKENADKNKWNGIFTWVGTFINDKKGFVTFNAIRTVDQNKMNTSGGAYLLAKEDVSGTEKGKIKYHKEVNESTPEKIASADDFEKYFPKEKSGGVVKNGDKTYGGFVDSKDKLGSICGSTNACGDDVPFKKQWDWNKGTGDGTTNNLGDGVNNFQWGERIYGNSPLNLESKINGFSGTWTLATKG